MMFFPIYFPGKEEEEEKKECKYGIVQTPLWKQTWESRQPRF